MIMVMELQARGLRTPINATTQYLLTIPAFWVCVLAPSAPPAPKQKACNFSANLLIIGHWQFQAIHEPDLIARFYFGKKKLVWEILRDKFKNKFEIEWSDVTGLKACFPERGYETLIVELARQPRFFKETDVEPKKRTTWQISADGQASHHRTHILHCPRGSLSKYYDILIQSDPTFSSMSQLVRSSYFESSLASPSTYKVPVGGFDYVASGYGSLVSKSSSPSVPQYEDSGIGLGQLSCEAPTPSSGFIDREAALNSDNVELPGLQQSVSMSNLLELCESKQTKTVAESPDFTQSDFQEFEVSINQLFPSGDTQSTTPASEPDDKLMPWVFSQPTLLQEYSPPVHHLKPCKGENFEVEASMNQLFLSVATQSTPAPEPDDTLMPWVSSQPTLLQEYSPPVHDLQPCNGENSEMQDSTGGSQALSAAPSDGKMKNVLSKVNSLVCLMSKDLQTHPEIVGKYTKKAHSIIDLLKEDSPSVQNSQESSAEGLESIGQYLHSGTQFTPASEGQSVQRVHSLGSLMQIDSMPMQNLGGYGESSQGLDLESMQLYLLGDTQPESMELHLPSDTQPVSCLEQIDPPLVHYWHANTSEGARDSSYVQTPEAAGLNDVSFSEQAKGVRRTDSYDQLLHNLPRIASLPKILVDC